MFIDLIVQGVTSSFYITSKCIEKGGTILEQEVLTEWFDKYGESLLTYILLMVRDYQQAEDLTQETFYRVFKNLSGYNGKKKFKSYVYI